MSWKEQYMIPKSQIVANIAVGLLSLPTIPYSLGGETLSKMDCQGMVEYCVRTAGGTMNYAGSNDMYRRACSWVGTLEQAHQQKKLVPGVAVFVVSKNGGEPAQYSGDGYGNASHVGLYCGVPGAEIMNSSSSRGCVAPSTFKNAWTHVGWLSSVDYSTVAKVVLPVAPLTPLVQTKASPLGYDFIVTGPGDVRMRLTHDDNAQYMGRIPVGESFDVIDEYSSNGNTWYRVLYKSFTKWWIKDGSYITSLLGAADVADDDPEDISDYQSDYDTAVSYLESAQALIDMGINATTATLRELHLYAARTAIESALGSLDAVVNG
ncbi:hypothetical protein FACS18948_3990 [Clostridia bacterium]|nr:hypothetical protein FACS18948_3990 [Clostridia bacterium]